ncbi:ABC transporter permease [Candidatus Woesearchaeota archaeon]|nr:ABC transporter permease [Candidatus Woesearchaeota archaeon]
MIRDYFSLVYKSAKQRKLRSWLTMMGIFIGIAAVVALISLSQGLQATISTQFMKLGSDKLVVQATGSGLGPPGTGVAVPLTINDKETIKKVSGVDLVVGRLLRIVKLEFEEEVKYSYVVSFPEGNRETELVVQANNYNIEEGRVLEKGDKYQVMVGQSFSEDFFGHRIGLRGKISVQDKEFKVVGILKKSGNPQQDSTLVVPEAALREILSVEEEYDLIVAKVQSGEDLSLVTENIKKDLRTFRQVDKGKEDFSVQTPESLLATLNNILLIIEGVLVGIAAISLLVGGVGIMNTMFTSVLERTKEIGIMKAIGAKNSEIMLLFLIESGFLGLVGGVIGVIFGLVISKSVELIAFQIYESLLIQAHFSFWLLGGALLFAFLVGTLSGVYPAHRAAKLNPIEALRK